MRYLIAILIVLNLFSGRSSHIVGGEIYYDYLGNNNYKFYISVYRDCLSSGASFDNPLSLGLFNSNNQLIQNVQIPFSGTIMQLAELHPESDMKWMFATPRKFRIVTWVVRQSMICAEP